jgi:hypothetical protein
MAYYAWTQLRTKVNEWGKTEEAKNVGDEVSQGDFEDMSDEDWQALIDSGAVREVEYPKGALESGESPERHRTNLLGRLGAGEQLTEDELNELNTLTTGTAVPPNPVEGESGSEQVAPEEVKAPAPAKKEEAPKPAESSS